MGVVALAALEIDQPLDEHVRLGELGGRQHLVLGRIGAAVHDVLADRPVEEVRELFGVEERAAAAREAGSVGPWDPGGISEYQYDTARARAEAAGEPYLAYGELQDVLRVPTRSEGDCYARFEVLREQLHVSLDLVDVCMERLERLPRGPINQRLPKVLKAPEGYTYAWTENPLGLNGYFLVSHGEKTPHRLKLRSASFNNVQVLSEMLPGQLVADMVAILGSMFFVVGDVDK